MDVESSSDIPQSEPSTLSLRQEPSATLSSGLLTTDTNPGVGAPDRPVISKEPPGCHDTCVVEHSGIASLMTKVNITGSVASVLVTNYVTISLALLSMASLLWRHFSS